jgi:hypothetical protein
MNTYHPKSESLREQLAALPRATIDATLHVVREGNPEGLRQWIGDQPEKCEAIRQLLLERRRAGKWPASLGEPLDYFPETPLTQAHHNGAYKTTASPRAAPPAGARTTSGGFISGRSVGEGSRTGSPCDP